MTDRVSPVQDNLPSKVKLHHGSSMAIERPDVSFNKGFSDLGQGFYLTDDRDAARGRALSRARVDGTACGIVSSFEFDEASVPWVAWGVDPAGPVPAQTARGNRQGGDALDAGQEPPGLAQQGSTEQEACFGLCFDSGVDGIFAWANYIKACRKGKTAVPGFGEPAVVRAWIATEEVEMVCSGFAPAEALAEFIEPDGLVVQYCFRDQRVIDDHLHFAGTEEVSVS